MEKQPLRESPIGLSSISKFVRLPLNRQSIERNSLSCAIEKSLSSLSSIEILRSVINVVDIHTYMYIIVVKLYGSIIYFTHVSKPPLVPHGYFDTDISGHFIRYIFLFLKRRDL